MERKRIKEGEGGKGEEGRAKYTRFLSSIYLAVSPRSINPSYTGLAASHI